MYSFRHNKVGNFLRRKWVFLLCHSHPVQLFKKTPQILIKLINTEILMLLHLMEKAFFEDAYSVFYRALEFWFADFRWQDDCLIMLSPFGVILIQLRSDPVLICDSGLLAIIADHKCRYSLKVIQSMVVHINPLGLLC